MPQLNPTPWFTTLLVTWMILLMILTKMIKHEPTNSIHHNNKHTQPTTPWIWPW